MTKDEQEIIWKHLFSLAFICGELACNNSENNITRTWGGIGSEQTRKRLMEAQEKLMKDLKFDFMVDIENK